MSRRLRPRTRRHKKPTGLTEVGTACSGVSRLLGIESATGVEGSQGRCRSRGITPKFWCYAKPERRRLANSLMEKRHGLVAGADVRHASGTGERDGALDQLTTAGIRQGATLGADKGTTRRTSTPPSARAESCRTSRATPVTAVAELYRVLRRTPAATASAGYASYR